MSTSDKITQPSADSEQTAVSISDDTLIDFSSQLPTFADLLPEQAKPYWQFVRAYPIVEAIAIFLIFWCLALFIRRYAITLIDRLANKTPTSTRTNRKKIHS